MLLTAIGALRPASAQTCGACGPLPTFTSPVAVSATGNQSSKYFAATSGRGFFSVTIAPWQGSLPVILPAGTYQAWCGSAPGDTYNTATGEFIASSDPVQLSGQQPAIPPQVWNGINYILNHKQGVGTIPPTVDDIQYAIWTLLGTVAEADLVASQRTAADQLYQAALQNPGFTPAAGQITALVLLSNAQAVQNLIVELVNCGSIGDRVWLQTQTDGSGNYVTYQRFNGSTPLDPGINGVTLQLLDSSGQPVLVNGQPVSTVTAPSPMNYPFLPPGTNGFYRFTGLQACSYGVQVVPGQPALYGLTFNATAGSTSVATDSNPNPSPAPVVFPTASPWVDGTIDFGFYGTPPISIACPLNIGYVSTPYTADYTSQGAAVTLGVTGGVTPYTYSATGLPGGLTLNANGTVTGTPAATGSYPVVFNVSGTTQACAITIKPRPVLAACPSGTPQTGIPYSGSYAAVGGTPPYAFSLMNPSTNPLPPGLALNGSTGAVSGTPTTANTYAFTAVIQDSTGTSLYTTSRQCALSVQPGMPILSCPVSTATYNLSYNSSLAATSGTAPYTFALVSGSSLPAGLTLNGSTGQVTGTPATVGAYSFNATVTDAQLKQAAATCSLNVLAAVTANCVTIHAVQGTAITPAQMTATGGTGAGFQFVAAGLPAGLTMSAGGLIFGTPTVSGTFSYTVTITDGGGNTGTVQCSVTVLPPVTAVCVTITAVQGTAIAPAQMTATGGTGAGFQFSATGLPAGLTISTSGVISGTPTVSGTFNYTVTITDGSGNTGTVQCSITVMPPVTATCVTITAIQGAPIAPAQMTATGGTGAGFQFSATGLPAGLTMSTSGVISGTPTVSGMFNYTVAITDGGGNTATLNCPLQVYPPPPAISCVAGSGSANVYYSSALSAWGGIAPYTYAIVAGSLPPGLTLNPTTGAITGTPTTAGTYNFTAQVTDSSGLSGRNTASASCSIAITGNFAALPPLSATCPVLNAVAGVALTSLNMTAAGGTGQGYSFSAAGLPAGLTMSSVGVISGTPLSTGAYSYSVTVTDSGANSTTINCNANVAANLPACPVTVGPLSYNVNESAVNASQIVWFNSHLTKLSGTIPASDFQIYVKGGQIAFGATTLAVPDAVLMFSSKVSCASTSFNAATKTWESTYPLSAATSADEIFMAGLAYALPAGFSQTVKSATWSATVYGPTDLAVTWQYGVSNWLPSANGTVFPMSGGQPDYNGMMINPAHGAPSCNPSYVSGDHAGAPEFPGRANVLTAGGSGGGGSNWTGSWSSTPAKTVVQCPCIATGDTATIGFWHNNNGQALIDSFNGGAGATALGNWLAGQFPSLYGPAGARNLAGLTNAQIAAAYMALFTGDKTGAQIMATAFAAYATSSTLSGSSSPGYGFTTSAAGTGVKTYNVGANGAAAGLQNGQTYSVMALLQAVNAAAQNGNYAQFAKGFNTIFSAINQTGDIN